MDRDIIKRHAGEHATQAGELPIDTVVIKAMDVHLLIDIMANEAEHRICDNCTSIQGVPKENSRCMNRKAPVREVEDTRTFGCNYFARRQL